jgi:phenylacetic acid degradation operon negative regulatory protein
MATRTCSAPSTSPSAIWPQRCANGPLLRRWRSDPAGEREAFADYVRVLTDWRRLPYLDPGLPPELLPGNWIGARAAELFFTLQARLEEAARAHVARVISG